MVVALDHRNNIVGVAMVIMVVELPVSGSASPW